MQIIEIILLILSLILIYLLIKKNDIKNIKISSQNKILFYKLKKQYLNNCSSDDIKQLIKFLNNVIKERGCYNESKKSRKKV